MTLGTHQPPGARLGSYEIVRSLGVGGMASVYEARHTVIGKRVAIKVLHEHLARNAVAAARFMREARAASAIRHPNVVQVFEIGLHTGTPFLIMELLEGQDLATYLLSRGRLSAASAVDVLLPIASAVAAAHAAGVIHRDLKPTNVFLANEGRLGVRAKVVDFGVSKQIDDEKERRLTETGMLLGTLEYMAPEQVRSAKNATERSDQYALGVILYECITGQRPFAGQSRYDLLHAIVTAPFATPRSLGIDLDPRLESTILRSMHRDPSQRFPSVESMGHSLSPCASEALRAWWRDDSSTGTGCGAGAASLEVCASAKKAEEEASASSCTPTMPEASVRKRTIGRQRRRLTGQALLAMIAAILVVAVTELRPRASTAQRQSDGVRQGISPVSAVAPEGDLTRGGQKPDVEPTRTEPTAVDTPSRPPIPGFRPQARMLALPSAPAVSPSSTSPSVSATPPVRAPPEALPRVERGYNGAPIVE
jgi:eukaryotic-like serine/threonine-protein kinase